MNIGGRVASFQFIDEHLQYPEDALRKKIKGKVILGLTIEADGSLTDIFVLKTIDQSLNEEAMRIVKHMPIGNREKTIHGIYVDINTK
ncbi:MAG: TonB family protein [Cytophagaceae bacterium]|nr:TonB family protein [Cytophagaceae bacterium]